MRRIFAVALLALGCSTGPDLAAIEAGFVAERFSDESDAMAFMDALTSLKQSSQ